jgi:hypothetical protein
MHSLGSRSIGISQKFPDKQTRRCSRVSDVPGIAHEGVGDFPRGFRLLQIDGDYPDRNVEPAAEFRRLRLKLRFNARDQHKPVSVRGKSARKVQPDPARGARDFL